MIRIILVALTLVLFLVFSIPILLWEEVLGKFNPEAKTRQSLAIVQAVFRFILKIAGTEVTVEGRENIPTDRAVLYVGNHRSYFDILIGYITVVGPTGFVAKKEMLRYPLLKNWMDNVHCLFLDRVNMKEGLKTILTGIDKVKHGISIWIFPEGTRNRNHKSAEMLPFKEGSLKIAEKSGCPVVPVAFWKDDDIFEAHLPFIRPKKVTIRYGTPFYTKELSPEDRKHCGAYTREIIAGMLKELQDEQA